MIYNSQIISIQDTLILETNFKKLLEPAAKIAYATLNPTDFAVAGALQSVTKLDLSDSKKSKDLDSQLTLNIIQKIKKPSPAKIAKFDDKSLNNKIKLHPQGVIICDTVNNPIFPIDLPIIDDSKFNLPDIKSRFQSYYCSLDFDFLPWHYLVEMIQGKYYFFQTRPLDMRFPIDNIELKDLLKTNRQYLHLTKSTEDFLESPAFDIQNAIHICIVGDTNKDVYLEKLYEMIGRVCCGPILRYFKLPTSVNQRVINFNLGNKFVFNKLDLYLKR